jgi:YbgC/YbaW family acyl-CoA thioester hydrolase
VDAKFIAFIVEARPIMITFGLRVINQLLLGSASKINIVRKAGAAPAYEVAFRAWPIDLDTYFHINNACYFRVAELARWRIFPQSNLYSMMKNKGVMFLVVEQTVKYFKPVSSFQKYIVSTSISYKEDKWFYYRHSFQQHPDDVKPGKEPVVYTVIDCKAVLKEKSGKTLRVGEFLPHSPLYKDLVNLEDVEAHHHHHK